MAFPEEHEDRGAVICEFDYDTMKELNRYSLKYYFFRAFEMKPECHGMFSGVFSTLNSQGVRRQNPVSPRIQFNSFVFQFILKTLWRFLAENAAFDSNV